MRHKKTNTKHTSSGNAAAEIHPEVRKLLKDKTLEQYAGQHHITCMNSKITLKKMVFRTSTKAPTTCVR